MITGHIIRQHLNLCDSHVVADTINYLEAKFIFKTDDWDGLTKWAHFANSDGTVYDIRLSEDSIRKEDHLNLSAGMWKVYLHGNEFADGEVIQRITTDEAVLYVSPTGTLSGEPFPEIPASVAEQLAAQIAAMEESQLSPIEKTDAMTQPVGRDEQGRLWTRPGGGSGGSGSPAYEIGFGLVLDGGVLSAEVGASSFAEIPNTKLQEIFNKAMEG